MEELHDRINRVINTRGFEESLERNGISLIEFQCEWMCLGKDGSFKALPPAYQEAILAGERDLQSGGPVMA